jgi:hypothetical protein
MKTIFYGIIEELKNWCPIHLGTYLHMNNRDCILRTRFCEMGFLAHLLIGQNIHDFRSMNKIFECFT